MSHRNVFFPCHLSNTCEKLEFHIRAVYFQRFCYCQHVRWTGSYTLHCTLVLDSRCGQDNKCWYYMGIERPSPNARELSQWASRLTEQQSKWCHIVTRRMSLTNLLFLQLTHELSTLPQELTGNEREVGTGRGSLNLPHTTQHLVMEVSSQQQSTYHWQII